MSRLIFEGDTTERFGDLIPNPFFEEIKVFNNVVETKIALFFEVPIEDEDVTNFISDLLNYEFYLKIGVTSERLVNKAIATNNFFEATGEVPQFFDTGTDILASLGSVIPTPGSSTSTGGASTSTGGASTSTGTASRFALSTSTALGVTRATPSSPSSTSGTSPSTSGVPLSREASSGAVMSTTGTVDSEAPTVSGVPTSVSIPFSELQSIGAQFDSSFYNSNGQRFLKVLLTHNFQKTDFNQVNIGGAFIVAFVHEEKKNIISEDRGLRTPADIEKGLSFTETSQFSTEKVFNSDGTISTERKIAYLESDGNYYNNIPLMSLDRNYRKINLLNHTQISSRIQQIIQPHVGGMADADLISLILAENATEPRLLIELQKGINKFSNKSTATVEGTLYSKLVDAVVELDSILMNSDSLQKRLVTNSKIKNLGIYSFANTDRLGSTDNIPIPGGGPDRDYFSLEPVYRYLSINVPVDEFNSEDEAFITTDVYSFFDYEKALNYKSEISNFFNPYNILELFGNNCLNDLFSVTNSEMKMTVNGSVENFFYFKDNKSYSSTQPEYQDSYTFYQGTEPYKFEKLFCERGFDTVQGLGGYRLKCYELNYSKPYRNINDTERIELKISVEDETMKFYDLHILKPLGDIRRQLNNYLNSASKFCSYNNIDERFNTFFASAVESEFSEPYPWETAPLYYASMLSLIRASWNFNEIDLDTGVPSITSRKMKGTSISLEDTKIVATNIRNLISPRSGKLESLEHFAFLFNELYAQIFAIGGALDTAGPIYQVDSATGLTSLRNPLVTKQFTSRSNRIDILPVDTDYKIANPSGYDINYLIPTVWTSTSNFLNVSYENMTDLLQNFVTSDNCKVIFTITNNDGDVINENVEKTMPDFLSENVNARRDGFTTTDGGLDIVSDVIDNFLFEIESALVSAGGTIDVFLGAVRMEPEQRWEQNYSKMVESKQFFRESDSGRSRSIRRTAEKKTAMSNAKVTKVRTVTFRISESSVELYLRYLMGTFFTYSYEIGDGQTELGEAIPINFSDFVRKIPELGI